MTRNEFNILFKTIQNDYSNFTGDYDEWYGVLIDYSYSDIINALNKRINKDVPPVHLNLIKGLKKEEKIDDWLTKCDLCGEVFTIHNNDMTDYEKHHRKCSKIDFINDMSLRIKHEPINKEKYYSMTDEELEKAYRPVMDYYLQTRKGEVLKKL